MFNDEVAMKYEGGPKELRPTWPHPTGKRKIMTQQIFALAALAIVFLKATLSDVFNRCLWQVVRNLTGGTLVAQPRGNAK